MTQSKPPFQVFYDPWWKNPQTGKYPQPFIMVIVDDVANKQQGVQVVLSR